MKTCEACKKPYESKNPYQTLCDICELEMLEHTAMAAVQDYIDKVNDILKKEKQSAY